jgi:hypothetical protein
MAPSRGKGKAREVPVTAPRRSTRARKNANAQIADATPDVYGEMVAEAVAAEPTELASRPLKRRKVSREPVTPIKTTACRQVPPSSVSETAKSTPAQQTDEHDESDDPTGGKPQQTVEYSSESEESDFAFEDVDLDQGAAASPVAVDDPDDDYISSSVQRDQETRRQSSQTSYCSGESFPSPGSQNSFPDSAGPLHVCKQQM